MSNINISNVITIHKGTTIKAPIFINIGTKLVPKNYTLVEGDTLYISIMEPNQSFDYGVIRKKLTKANLDELGFARFSLDPTDTINLLSGVYYIQMKLKLADSGTTPGGVATIMPKTKFIILD